VDSLHNKNKLITHGRQTCNADEPTAYKLKWLTAVAEKLTHVVNNVDVARKTARYLRYRVCIKEPATNKRIY